MSDFVRRLGGELTAASERQSAGRRLRWPARRSGRLLLIGGAAFALGGAGGAASLIAGRGEVGGPPTLTYARLTPEQRAAGLHERTRPVVIGRGRLPVSRRAWQLVAFQTTRGLCIAIDFPAVPNLGGGCGSDRPRERRLIDWQGYLAQFGRAAPDGVAILGAVTPAAARVTVTGGYRDRRVARPATIVRVSDPRVLAAIEVRRPFAYYVGETLGGNPMAASAAFDAQGSRLGRAGIPNGGAGSGGFRLPEGSCSVPDPFRRPVRDVSLELPPELLAQLAVLRRPQQPSDRPVSVERRLRTGPASRFERAQTDFARMRRLPLAPGAPRRFPNGRFELPGRSRERYLVVSRPGAYPQLPDGCLRTATPRQRALDRRGAQRAQENARIVRLTVVDGNGFRIAATDASRPFDTLISGGYGGAGRTAFVTGMVPDGVATVELWLRGHVIARGRPAGNHFTIAVPVRSVVAARARQVWRDARGRVVRRG